MRHITTAIVSILFLQSFATAAGVQSEELRAGKDDDKQYFLMQPANTKAPAKGFGLVLILPGGDGSAAFNPFCQRIVENGLPGGYLAAQLVAKKWNENQQIVWPTAKTKAPGQKFTTEEFIDAVVKDVKAKHKIDDERIHLFAWSSGGPAAYAATLTKGTPVRGAFVAMSVFKPQSMPPLAMAKDKAFYVLHSPEDKLCPMRMAEAARDDFAAAGGRTKLTTYAGGHGWHGDVFQNIRDGIAWLEQQK